MSCSQVDTIPEKVDYQFTGSASIYKMHNFIKLTARTQWRSAQTGSLDDYAPYQEMVFLNPEDFSEIWNFMRQINFMDYQKPDEAKFDKTPPDMQYMEHLVVIIDATTHADWAYGGRRLKKDYREPLDSLTVLLGKEIARRQETPAIPTDLVMKIIRGDEGKQTAFDLTKKGDTIFIQKSESTERVYVDPSQFSGLFAFIQNSGIMTGPYSSAEAAPSSAGSARYIFDLRVNGEPAANALIMPDSPVLKKFDQLWNKLNAIGK